MGPRSVWFYLTVWVSSRGDRSGRGWAPRHEPDWQSATLRLCDSATLQLCESESRLVPPVYAAPTHLRINHHVHLLGVEPALRVLISISNDQHLVVVRRKLDVAVPLLYHRVERPDLVLAGIPIHFEVLLLVLAPKLLVQPIDDLFVGSALERDGFALVVETQVEEEDDFDTATTRLLDGADNGSGIKRGRLPRGGISAATKSHTRTGGHGRWLTRADGRIHSHKHLFLGVPEAGEPRGVLRVAYICDTSAGTGYSSDLSATNRDDRGLRCVSNTSHHFPPPSPLTSVWLATAHGDGQRAVRLVHDVRTEIVNLVGILDSRPGFGQHPCGV
jgi:hypothetical protein